MVTAKAIEQITGVSANPYGPWRLTDSGNGPYISHWDTDTLGPQPTQAQIDAAIVELNRPKHEVRAWGRALETLRPYYVSRSLMNQYQAMSAAEKEAFRAQFQVGQEDRWTILKNFVLAIRAMFSANPLTWADWDNAHPEYTEADFRANWETIQGWGEEA